MLGKKYFLISFFLGLLATWQLFSADLVAAADPTPRIQTKHVYQERNGKKCSFSNGCVEAGKSLNIDLEGISFNDGAPFPDGGKVGIRLIGQDGCNGWPDPNYAWAESGDCEFTAAGKYVYCTVKDGKLNLSVYGNQIKSQCSYKVEAHLSNDYYPGSWGGIPNDKGTPNNTGIIGSSLKVGVACSADQCNEDLEANSSYDLCKQINTNTLQYKACTACFASNGVWTAVGCIPSSPQSVIKVVVTIGLGLGGGVVLIMILVGAATLSVSQGDPNKTKEAQEMITSAVIGLVFVIFSITILQFIGVSILRIPGFGG